MRVLVDTSYAARGPSGTAVYLERLLDALRQEGGVEVLEARQPRRLRSGRSGRGWNPLRSAANAALDLHWLHRGLPRTARETGADVVHHPLPVYSRHIDAAQVATYHDVAFERFPEAYGRSWRQLARRQYRRAARRCDALVCVSAATARDVIDLFGAPSDRVVVASHGPGQALPRADREPEPRHFLYVGDAEPRKGISRLTIAYEVYRGEVDEPLPLVLAGGAARLARGPGVRGEPNPSLERLSALLAGAAALVHGSIHEGFGLTLVEAMAAGTPVVAARNPGTEEICGEAALLTTDAGLADGLVRIARDAELRERLSRAGRERAARFSWDESARLHERAYTLAVRTRTRAGDPG